MFEETLLQSTFLVIVVGFSVSALVDHKSIVDAKHIEFLKKIVASHFAKVLDKPPNDAVKPNEKWQKLWWISS